MRGETREGKEGAAMKTEGAKTIAETGVYVHGEES